MRIAVVCGLLLLYTFVQGQNYPIMHYTNHDGLPQMQIMSLFTDSRGVLWIGTKYGVSRYNGVRFDNLSPTVLKGSLISDINEDKSGNVWFTIGYGRGTTQYDGKTFRHFEHIKSGLQADRQGRLWTLVEGKLSYLQGDTLTKLPPFPQFRGKPISYLAVDRQYNRLIIGADSVGLFSWTKQQLTPLPIPFVSGFADTVIRRQNQLIIAAADLQGRRFSYYNHAGQFRPFLEYLPTDTVRILRPIPTSYFVKIKGQTYFVQKETTRLDLVLPTWGHSATFCALGDHFFVGTEQGLYHLTDNGFRHFTNQQAPYVWSVAEDRQGQIWWMNLGHRIRIWNGETVREAGQYPFADRWYFGSLRSRQHGDLYLAHESGVVRTNGQTFRSLPDTAASRHVWDLHEDTHRNLLIKTGEGYFQAYRNDSLIRRVVLSQGALPRPPNAFGIAQDKQQNYWIAGNDGLWHYNWETARLTPYLSSKKRFPHKNGLSVCVDSAGTVWVGTERGLLYFDPRANQFRPVVSHLIQSPVFYLGAAGRFLLAGDLRALYALDLERFHRTGRVAVKGFTNHNGFMGIEPGQNGFFQDSKKRIWIPSGTVLSYLEPDKLHVTGSPLRVSIRSVNDTLLPFRQLPTDVVRLNRNVRTVNVQFEATGFDRPDQTEFSWQLDDQPWSQWLATDVAYLTDLTPGDHQFRVKVRRNSQMGQADPETSIRLRTDLPFWYQPFMSYAGMLAFGGLIVMGGYLFFRDRRSQLRLDQQDQQLLFLQVQTLQSQLNPHFVFNVLGTMQKMIMSNDYDRANQSLVRLAQLIRSFLESSVRSEMSKSRSTDMEIRLDKEIDLLKLYVEFEHLQYRDRFTYSFTIDPELVMSMCSVPPMLIQPFVENAIKHGLLYKDDPGNLWISVRREGEDQVLVLIEDDGVGRRAADQMQTASIKPYISRGSNLVKKRIDVLNQLDYSIQLTINDRPQGGTIVRLLFDYQGKS